MGKPDKTTQAAYERIVLDDLVIWKASDVEAEMENGVIEVSVTGFLFFQTLSLKGAKATPDIPTKKAEPDP